MTDHDGVDPTPQASPLHPSRRAVLRAGLAALAATQLPDGVIAPAFAQVPKPGPSLIGHVAWARTPTGTLVAGAVERTDQRFDNDGPW